MRYINRIFVFLASAILLAGCSNNKELAYFHDAPRDKAHTIDQTYEGDVHKGDVLHIYVSSVDAESVIPFNQETNKVTANVQLQESAAVNLSEVPEGATIDLSGMAASTVGYLVDNEGNIIFPMVGKLHVEGLSLEEVSLLVQRQLTELNHVKDPTVTTRLLNFRVAVLGEVNNPSWVYAEGTRLTLLEALAMVGDMTLYGVRSNVHVIRESNGQVQVGEVDLTSQNLFESPFYYLQQNDVVFVEPNKKRKRVYSRNDQIMNYIYLGVGIGSLTTNTTRLIYQIMTSR